MMQDAELHTIEFYAGNGNLTKCMRYAGYRTGSLDIKYPGSRDTSKVYSSNVMDITSPSGFWFLDLFFWLPGPFSGFNLHVGCGGEYAN